MVLSLMPKLHNIKKNQAGVYVVAAFYPTVGQLAESTVRLDNLLC